MGLVDEARELYKLGFHVIPLRYASKVPALPQGHGLLGRRATAGELRGFDWEGVGIVTGSLSGVVVLDIDGDRGERSMSEGAYHRPLTVVAKTPNGWHHYYRYDSAISRNYIGTIAEGVDIKSNGGYVVAPPSIHPSGEEYKWADEMSPWDLGIADAPSWMMERLQNEGEYSTPWNVGDSVWGEGTRNTRMCSLAGTLYSRGFGRTVVEATLLGVNQQNCTPPMPQEEVLGIVDKIGRYYEG